MGGWIGSKNDKENIKVQGSRASRALIQGIGAESLVSEGDASDGDLCSHLAKKHPGLKSTLGKQQG